MLRETELFQSIVSVAVKRRKASSTSIQTVENSLFSMEQPEGMTATNIIQDVYSSI
jgi:hypothetical protein